MTRRVRRFLTDEQGADLIEYALIAALISLAGVMSLTSVGTTISTLFGSIDTKVSGITVP